MSDRIEITTLTDGGQQPADVARRVAAFLDGAERTLDLAQYDFNLGEETKAIVSGAIERAAARGVQIRFAYNVDHASPIPVPPPPEPDVQLIATLPVARNRAAVAAASVFFSIWFLRISRDPGSGPLVTAGNSHRGKCLSISLHINL